MACSKELDLCYNFHIFGFGILAIRRSGILTSGAAPQMTQLPEHLTRVQGNFVRPKLFARERYPKSLDPTRHLGRTPPERFWDPLFVQLMVAPLLDIPLSAARKWDKEGRRTVPWEPHSTYHTTVFRYALGQGRKRLYPGLGECAAWMLATISQICSTPSRLIHSSDPVVILCYCTRSGV